MKDMSPNNSAIRFLSISLIPNIIRINIFLQTTQTLLMDRVEPVPIFIKCIRIILEIFIYDFVGEACNLVQLLAVV